MEIDLACECMDTIKSDISHAEKCPCVKTVDKSDEFYVYFVLNADLNTSAG